MASIQYDSGMKLLDEELRRSCQPATGRSRGRVAHYCVSADGTSVPGTPCEWTEMAFENVYDLETVDTCPDPLDHMRVTFARQKIRLEGRRRAVTVNPSEDPSRSPSIEEIADTVTDEEAEDADDCDTLVDEDADDCDEETEDVDDCDTLVDEDADDCDEETEDVDDNCDDVIDEEAEDEEVYTDMTNPIEDEREQVDYEVEYASAIDRYAEHLEQVQAPERVKRQVPWHAFFDTDSGRRLTDAERHQADRARQPRDKGRERRPWRAAS